MLARLEIRRRWRGAVLLIVLVGVVGAVVLTTLAGARRTESSLRRFNEASRSADVTLLPPFGYTPTAAEMAALRRVPNVAAVAELRSFAILPRNAPITLGIASARDDAIGTVIDRDRVVDGRRANPNAADEVAISESLAGKIHQGVGGHLDLVAFTPEQLVQAAATGAPPPLSQGRPLRFKIVGIVRRPLDLGSLAGQGGVVVLTRAFDRENVNRIGSFGATLRVRTVHGEKDVGKVVEAARRVFKAAGGQVSAQGSQTEIVGAQDAVDVLTLALRIFAIVVALAAVIAVAIVLTREIALANTDQETLSALGVTRVQRILANAPHALLVATLGAVLAVCGAIAASPLLPIGVARKAEPDLGTHADWSVLLPGIAITVAVVLSIALLAALVSARRAGVAERPSRRPGLVDKASARLAPVPAAGLRMALKPGREHTAVPARSACFGAVFGVLGVVAVLVFAASLDRLVSTPREYGWDWDFTVNDSDYTPQQPRCGTESFGLADVEGVGALAGICDNDIELDRRPVTAWGVTQIRGVTNPTMIEGRAPRNAGEVALGAKTLDAMHKRIGQTVRGHDQAGRAVDFRIVGRVALPTLVYPQPLADGAVFTGAGLMKVYDPNSRASRNFVGRFSPGTSHAVVAREVARLNGLGPLERSTVPVEIQRVRDVNWIPATLAIVMAALALVAIGHALVTATRRRRHDLAVLRTLGFSRRQTRATVGWQATFLAAVGLAFGIPLGIVMGRTAWDLAAEGLGVDTITSVPALALLVTVPLAALLVNALGFLPGRAAARISPAAALRTE